MKTAARYGRIRAALTITAAALLACAAITDLARRGLAEDDFVSGYATGVRKRRFGSPKRQRRRCILRLVS